MHEPAESFVGEIVNIYSMNVDRHSAENQL